LVAWEAPARSSSIWISPTPPPISTIVEPSMPRSRRKSTIRREVLSSPRLRYLAANREAKDLLKNLS
jgi:hypothetical protein